MRGATGARLNGGRPAPSPLLPGGVVPAGPYEVTFTATVQAVTAFAVRGWGLAADVMCAPLMYCDPTTFPDPLDYLAETNENNASAVTTLTIAGVLEKKSRKDRTLRCALA